MSIKLILKCALLFFLIGCTETEVKQFDFKGDINFKVTTYAEWGSPINDKGNVAITILGSDPEIKAYTDTAGNYVVKNLPLGTYDVLLEKEGYGSVKLQQFKFIGSEEPYNLNLNLTQKCSTKVESYSMSISGSNLIVSGIISHNYPKQYMINYPSNWPTLVVYLSKTADVSHTLYMQGFYVNSNKENATTFNASISLYSLFPSGSTIYAVIYGQNYNNTYFFDYETGEYYNPTMGVPSEVKSIIVP